MRGETEGVQLPDLGAGPPSSDPRPSVPHGFAEPQRISSPPAFGPPLVETHADRGSLPPPAPAFPPSPEPQPERSSFAPPVAVPNRLGAQTGGHARPHLDSRKEPTAPSTRYVEPPPFGGGEIRKMLSGEVFGAPVPVALAVAFLIALAMVVLVYIVVG